MTKKTVTLILLITIFFSIIAMGVWGMVPETLGDIYVNEINFYNHEGAKVTEINESENKEKKIVLQKEEAETYTYLFYVELLPANATDLSMKNELVQGDATFRKVDYIPFNLGSEDTSEQEGSPRNITTYEITFTKQSVTILSFTCKSSSTQNLTEYLMFTFDGGSHHGDIDL